jgi:transcriptional regulator with XRE-family HTH domain
MDNIEFKRLRLKLGLTQLQMASSLGLAANSIARIERGELPLRKVVSLAVLYLDSVESKQVDFDDRLSSTYREEQPDLPIFDTKPVVSKKEIVVNPNLPRKPVRSSPRKKNKRKK